MIQAFVNWYKKLSPKERWLLIIFVTALSGSFYFNAFFKPTFSQIAKLKRQEQETKNQRQLLTSQFPDLDKTKREIEDIKKSIEALDLTMNNTQLRLIGVPQVPQLLAAIIKCTQDLTIDFQSVKQKTETDKDGFSHLFVDVKFESTFEDMVNYLKRLEEISTFVKVEEIDVAQSKTDMRNFIMASLQLSTVLSSAASPQGELSLTGSHDSGTPLIIKHSPFVSRLNIGEAKKKTLKLTGITYSRFAKASTAIINDTVIRVGDEIEGQKAEKILPDAVVINDGRESYKLTVQRE